MKSYIICNPLKFISSVKILLFSVLMLLSPHQALSQSCDELLERVRNGETLGRGNRRRIHRECLPTEIEAFETETGQTISVDLDEGTDNLRNQFNREVGPEASNQEADRSANLQTIAGAVAKAGANVAMMKAATDCIGKPNEGKTTCWLWPIGSSLLSHGVDLLGAAGDNRNVANQYRGGRNSRTSSDSSSDGTDDGNGSTSTPPPSNNPTVTTTINDLLTEWDNQNPYNGTDDPIDPDLKKKFEKITYDKKDETITLPDGTTYKASDAEKILAGKGGASPKALSEIKDHMKKVEQKLLKEASLSAAANTGIGTPGVNTDLGGGGFSGYDGLKKKKNKKDLTDAMLLGLNQKKNLQRGLSGMAVKVGNDQVGISQSNIFEIVHRRYQKERGEERFFENPNY